jgi:hypothetical protein
MAKVLGFVHRIEWGSRYVRAPEGRDVAVEVFLPVEDEGCREKPREIEENWHLGQLGYVYTVRAVTKSKVVLVRSLHELPGSTRRTSDAAPSQLQFDFGMRRY